MTKVPTPTGLSPRSLRTLKLGKKYHSGTISMGVTNELAPKSPRHGSAEATPIDAAETPAITTGNT